MRNVPYAIVVRAGLHRFFGSGSRAPACSTRRTPSVQVCSSKLPTSEVANPAIHPVCHGCLLYRPYAGWPIEHRQQPLRRAHLHVTTYLLSLGTLVDVRWVRRYVHAVSQAKRAARDGRPRDVSQNDWARAKQIVSLSSTVAVAHGARTGDHCRSAVHRPTLTGPNQGVAGALGRPKLLSQLPAAADNTSSGASPPSPGQRDPSMQGFFWAQRGANNLEA